MTIGHRATRVEAEGRLVRPAAVEERPRERLLRGGPRGLSDAELVSVILRTGNRGCGVLSLAHDLLRGVGGLKGLAVSDSTSFERYRLGPARSATVLAAVEIGRRLARVEISRRDPMSHPLIRVQTPPRPTSLSH